MARANPRKARSRRPAGLVAAALVVTFTAMFALASCSGPPASTRTHPARQSSGPTPKPAHPRDDSGYLALGDSVAFGYRPASVTQPMVYLNAANFTGYPEDLAKTLRLRVVNASCPGETSASMINSAAQNNGCESTVQGGSGYRSFAPLHVGYRGSQLSYAVRYVRRNPQTALVTIGIGANDLFVCQQTTADDCTGADFGRVLAKITSDMDTILSALRNRASYRHALVIVTYYALNYGDSTSLTQTRELDAALTGLAVRYDAQVADGYAAFRAASATSGGDTCTAGLRIKLPAGGCDLHPSALGQRVLALAILRALAHRGQ